jgi:hypothetical protein
MDLLTTVWTVIIYQMLVRVMVMNLISTSIDVYYDMRNLRFPILLPIIDLIFSLMYLDTVGIMVWMIMLLDKSKNRSSQFYVIIWLIRVIYYHYYL